MTKNKSQDLPSNAQFIFQDLKDKILEGTYPSGSKLPAERSLAKEYQVSRTTVREAIGQLRQLGLVRAVPQSGTYVQDLQGHGSLHLLLELVASQKLPDRETLYSLMEFRRLVEIFAMRKAIHNLQPEDIKELNQLLRQSGQARHNPQQVADLNYQLHFKLISRANNRVIWLIFNSFKWIYRYYIDLFFGLPDVIPIVLEKYQRLLKGLANGDENYVTYILEEILIFGENRVKEYLMSKEEPVPDNSPPPPVP